MESNNPKQINQIPFKFDSRYVFSDTPTRIARMVTDEKSVENLVMLTQLPYVFTNEPIPLVFNYSLTEAMMQESYSKVSWLITHKNIQSPILLSFNLTENTIEKTVLVIFEIEIIKRELIPEQYVDKVNNTFPQVCVEMIKNMDKELEEDNKDIYHYESKILHYSREKIWEIISNFHCLMEKQGIIKDCCMKKPITKEGCELSFILCEKNKLCKMKVNKYKNDENNNKWKLGTIPLCGPFAHSENYWTLIKLNDNETLVSNTTKYSEHIEPDQIKKLSEEKIKTFISIEDILKTKYGDNNKNTNENIDKNNNNNNKEDKKEEK